MKKGSVFYAQLQERSGEAVILDNDMVRFQFDGEDKAEIHPITSVILGGNKKLVDCAPSTADKDRVSFDIVVKQLSIMRKSVDEIFRLAAVSPAHDAILQASRSYFEEWATDAWTRDPSYHAWVEISEGK
jgi:hypothetical protein